MVSKFLQLMVMAVLMLPFAVSPAFAQDKAPAPKKEAIVVPSLTKIGFEIVAMQMVNKTVLLTLQRSERVFICEVNLNGSTKRCVEIR